MIRATLIAAALLAAGTMDSAFAQEKHRSDGARDDHRPQQHFHGAQAGHHGYYAPHRHGYYAPRYYSGPAYRYYEPRAYFAPPIYGPLYPYAVYESPPPVIVERYYEAPVYEAPPQRSFEERSYAQIVPRETSPPPAVAPSAPRPQAPIAPQPRFERYTLSARELFDFDQATLRKPQPKLDEIATALQRHADIEHVNITGYTDRIGTDAYNLKLSQRRADAVKAYLVGKGVAAQRLTAIGKGKANPVVECHDKDRAALIKCLEPNRRVEVEQITIERQVAPR